LPLTSQYVAVEGGEAANPEERVTVTVESRLDTPLNPRLRVSNSLQGKVYAQRHSKASTHLYRKINGDGISGA